MFYARMFLLYILCTVRLKALFKVDRVELTAVNSIHISNDGTLMLSWGGGANAGQKVTTTPAQQQKPVT